MMRKQERQGLNALGKLLVEKTVLIQRESKRVGVC